MATYNIVIQTQVNGAVTGIRQVGKELDDVSKTVTRLRTLIKDALVFTGIGFGIKELINLSDTYIKLENRIRLVTKSQEDLSYTMDRLFAISQRTRVSFDSTVTLFTRTASATRDLGITQGELFRVVESVNQAVAISGATSIEASNALIQFSQGLASARLGGEELRSVLEQLPAIADVIAEKLGVTRGALRNLAAQGVITPKVIIEAFQKARQELADKFATTIPTIGQSFQILNDQVLKFIGRINDSTGISAAFARSVIFVAQNLDKLATIVETLAVAYALRLVPAIIASTAAMFANAGAFIALAAGVTTFAEAQTLAAAATVGWTGALGLLKLAVLSVPLLALAYVITRLITGTNEVAEAQARYSQSMNEFSGIVGQIVNASGERRAKLIADSQAIIQQNIKELESLNNLIEGYANARSESGTLLGSLSLAGQEAFGRIGIGTAPSDAFKKSDALRQTIKKMKEDLAEAENPTPLKDTPGKKGKTGPTFDSIIADLEKQKTLLQVNVTERERLSEVYRVEDQLKRQLTTTEKTYLDTKLRELQALQDQADILDSLRAPQEALTRGTDALNVLFEKGAISVQEYNDKLVDLQITALAGNKDMESGIKRGLLQINKQFTDVASLAETTLVNAFKKAEDALVEFAQTGKFNFKDLVTSINADLLRLQIRQNLTGPLAQMAGIAGGGSSGGGGGGGGLLGSLSSGLGGLFNSWSGGAIGGSQSGLARLIQTGDSNFVGPLPVGFATGGSFMVGGNGGTDTSMVAFKATPGEMVSITRPGQRSSDVTPANNNGPVQPVINNFNITTPDANSFRQSQSQIAGQASRFAARARRNN